MGKMVKVLWVALIGAVAIILLDSLTGFQQNPTLAQVPHDVANIVLGGILAIICFCK